MIPSMKHYGKSLGQGSILLGMLLFYPMFAAAQTNVAATNGLPGTATGVELFPANANGEVVTTLGHYWDGVDDNDNLHVMVSTFPVLNNVGAMSYTTFAPAVNFVDMNNDGLKDLVVGDTYGFLWIYFNSGAKGAPLFTTGTIFPTFLGWASKIHVVDWDGDLDNDIVVGTFYGDFAVLSNMGGATKPLFTRTMGIPRYVSPYYSEYEGADRLNQVKLGKIPFVLGIYTSPWVTDWNNDFKPDLIFGEGTYSANSIRIAFNQGSRGKPIFKEDRVFYLAYGEGYEQLTPSVVDYNGDGVPDLMCGTRTGRIRLFKGTTKPVEGADIVTTLKGTKAPAALEFDKVLEIEGKGIFDTMTNPFPCDWNDDGLFDILMGSTKGTIYVALNKGTKIEPSFPDADMVKGTNVNKDLLAPARWWNGIGHATGLSHSWGASDYIGDWCNSAVLLSCETNAVLRPGLPVVKPVEGEFFMYFRYDKNYPGWNNNSVGARVFGGNFRLPMVIGKRYELTFSSILLGNSAYVGMVAYEPFEGTELVPPHNERREYGDNITPTAGWQKKTINFVCPGKQTGMTLNFELGFALPAGDCHFCVDAFSLKEVLVRR